jgi:5-formyltetrahydrofolate cyclo-ligase
VDLREVDGAASLSERLGHQRRKLEMPTRSARASPVDLREVDGAASQSERLGSQRRKSEMRSAEKSTLRAAAREKRYALKSATFAAALTHHAESLNLAKGTIVGGYHALPDEANPALLLERLVELGCHIAYPRVAGKGLPLEFHRVPDGEVLAPGAFGIHEPLDTWPKITPQALLVPLLAFDSKGHRLGYGGGFYDRTIALLKVPAIGIAYSGQETETLPAEEHDAKLNAVLTETGLTRFPE